MAGQFDDDDDSGVDQPIDRRSAQSRVRSVGGKPVCVRLCDGYFFPLHLRGPNLDEDGDQACAALCPAAETRMYRMSSDIGGARDREGQNYTELPNAFRYRQSYNPSCVCRAPNQGAGSQAFLPLNPGERGASGFLEMNPALEETPVEDDAAALRGGEKPVEKTTSAFGKRPPPAPPQEPLITADRLVPVEEGATQETRGPNGVKRTVRVIAPELFRAP